jgi:hypothetical protein
MHIFRLVSVAVALVVLAAPAVARTPTYKTETGAQKHCPGDAVVWVNTKSGIYHLKGGAQYANTKDGNYMCKADADASGFKASANGQ